ncbi:uncharacterized protein LOC121728198 [Aricia agestis]|uniref:uncharacterized protein LOC121728198 n=1 Tax=Aricia agestis TaxID=91739 RepID=UPI001C20969D|nr:uncharacterized protein LOC121728198 [Aricia agestis]
MTEQELAMEKLEETVKHADQQLDLMEWKMDNVEREMACPVDNQDVCIINLLKSVSEVRSEYASLRRELGEVQALQRELSARLRSQLRQVHGRFARLRDRLAAAAARPAPP